MSELGTSLAVQWLRLHILSAGVSSSILGQQSISHMLQLRRPSQINIKKKKQQKAVRTWAGEGDFPVDDCPMQDIRA